jgi:N-acetyl-gamma-glutamyl-phosphate reductase
MLVDAYCIFDGAVDADAIRESFAQAYAQNPFVRLLGDGFAPSLPAVAGTNDAEIAISVLGDVVRVICAIDNLGRGAAGQAIRNLNIMHGFPEELGLGAIASTVHA